MSTIARRIGPRLLTATLFAIVAITTVPPVAHGATTAKTVRASVSYDGFQGNGSSAYPRISADGRYVVFQSNASNLVGNDTNGLPDVFLRDRVAHTTVRVNVRSSGQQADAGGYSPAISANGRFVAYYSDATNLVPNDTNGTIDIFMYDAERHTTRRVSVTGDGFEGNGGSLYPAISANGRYVAFDSTSTNLVGNDTNLAWDVFVRDRKAHTTKRVSVSSAGAQGDYDSGGPSLVPSISADGRFVAFTSLADNLVKNDTNTYYDVFVRDVQQRTTTRVSVASDGSQGDSASFGGSLSADGRYVAFDSPSSNFAAHDTNGVSDVFVRDRKLRTTTLVSRNSKGAVGNDESSNGTISSDGTVVAFISGATNLVGSDTNAHYDVFVRDRTASTTKLVSQSSSGARADGDSIDLVLGINGDGRFVAFTSAASNLVADDTNAASDVFVRGPI